jgi:hypothetical protein
MMTCMNVVGRPLFTVVMKADDQGEFYTSLGDSFLYLCVGKILGIMVSAYYQKRTGKLRLLFWGELFNLMAMIL